MRLSPIPLQDVGQLPNLVQGLLVTHVGNAMLVVRDERQNHIVTQDAAKGPKLWDSPNAISEFCRHLGIPVRQIDLGNDHGYTAWLEVSLGDVPLPAMNATPKPKTPGK